MESKLPSAAPSGGKRGILDWIEIVGNKFPETALLFVLLAALVVALSAVGSTLGWKVQPVQVTVEKVEKRDTAGNVVLGGDGRPVLEPKVDGRGNPVTMLSPAGAPIEPKSLLTSEGVYWMLSSMLRNFTSLPALPLIFVALLAIGVAERFGYFAALMRALAIATPKRFLTPMVVFLGANSSVASDAGYVILPPLAAALYLAVGRHPVAGLAAAFAGVSGGFGAGFFPSGGDGVLAGFAQDAARVIDPEYTVDILHVIYFKAVSAVVIALAGWFVTDRIIEPRLLRAPDQSGVRDGDAVVQQMALVPAEKRALALSSLAAVLTAGVFVAMILVPGAPLNGYGLPLLPDGRAPLHHAVEIKAAGSPADAPPHDVLTREPLLVIESTSRARLDHGPGPRWSHVIVPMIFFTFLVPGLVFGWLTGKLKTQKDAVEGLTHGISSIVPVMVILFFMGQFVSYFAYSRLDRMLAYGGGTLLVGADLPIPLLIALFVVLVVVGDFAISGALSKFGVLAPIFIPMFMLVGMSPELTTGAYRIGDSVVNIITPMNSYVLIILAVLQKYRPTAGFGSLVSLMVPYSVVFLCAWTGLLLVWYAIGLPLGPGAPLHVGPAQ
jgi:aminobenzoyl-glutamate transport protein